MADVEFEPLHGENEEEAEFILGGKKKEGSAKKHKQKGGQLFPRKGVEKKDKTVVIDNSKAFGTTPSSVKSSHFTHHHQRTVEGLVGPGDIQFSSSPPNYDDDSVIPNNISQSTGSIPLSVNQNQAQRSLHLPPRPTQPPPWTQGIQAPPNTLQQKTLSQEKLTLLEQANYVASSTKNQLSQGHTSEGVKTPDRPDVRRNFQTPSFQTQIGATTPPRVASPTEAKSFSPPQFQSNEVSGKKFARSESWGPNTQSDPTFSDDNWADFSKSFDGSLSADEVEFEATRRRQSQVSTISEGSEGSYVSEIDDSVWKITEEQRIYYVAQFKKLQPNESGLIKGPQARDFFMKSNLPVEVLSKIWHLSDINKDSALDLEEFCIAMHLVVAVKHEVELPMVLPAMLLPKYEAQHFEASFPPTSDDVQTSSNQNGYQEEERPHSPQQQVQEDQHWAKFEVSGPSSKQESTKEDHTFHTRKQTHSVEEDAEDKTQTHHSTDDGCADSGNDMEHLAEDSMPGASVSRDKVARTPIPKEKKPTLQETNNASQSPTVTKESLSKKSSIGIARPRGMGPAINLMDAAPGQLLPPPGSRKNWKMAQQAQPEPAGHISPPSTPESRFSSNFSNEFQLLGKDFTSADSIDKPKQKDTEQSEVVHEQKKSDVEVKKRVDVSQNVGGSQDGFEPPKLAPRRNQSNLDDASKREETAETFIRRSSSVRRGGRPRSYTADSKSSMESLVDIIPNVETKDITVPPTPPPRKMKSHKRGSSLDLNKIFAKSQQNIADANKRVEREIIFTDSLPPRIPRTEHKDEKKEKKEKGDIQGIARPRPAPKNHRRSISHDTSQPLAPLAPPPKTAEGVVKESATPGHRKKPAPPRPSSATRNGRSKSLERTIESTKVEETVPFDKKPRPLSRPLRHKRQKHEIQAEIRSLREKNASISSLNSELHHELREAMETRTILETKLAKTRQSFE